LSSGIASIIGSGINGNLSNAYSGAGGESLLLLEVELMETLLLV